MRAGPSPPSAVTCDLRVIGESRGIWLHLITHLHPAADTFVFEGQGRYRLSHRTRRAACHGETTALMKRNTAAPDLGSFEV